jgi:hypothetical protein
MGFTPASGGCMANIHIQKLASYACLQDVVCRDKANGPVRYTFGPVDRDAPRALECGQLLLEK